MRITEETLSDTVLKLPDDICSFLNLGNGEKVQFIKNTDGTVTIRKKTKISNLKGIVKKGETANIIGKKTHQIDTALSKEEL